MSTKYVPSLNGLRAISILFVIIGHMGFRNFHKVDSPGGQLGVNIFFIVSGFLITKLLLEEEKMNGKISLEKFYVRRVFRIFPAFYFLLLVYFFLQLAGILHFHTNSWITSLTYTKYFPIRNGSEWETDHLWSLSVEEHFYLLWPFIFRFLKPHRVKIALLIILVIPILRGINFWNGGEVRNAEAAIYYRADALMMGCLLAIYLKEISAWVVRIVDKNRLFIFLPAAGLFSTVIVFKLISIYLHNPLEGAVMRALGRSTGTFTCLFECLAIVVSIGFKNNLWYRFLNSGAMNYIGKLSYSLYLWQQLFFSFHIGYLSKFPINIFCIFTVAILSYHFIEKPFLKLKAKFEVERIPARLAPQVA
jgi:peptidoglycan/LPS O-acetylase OafA/YrhL